MNNRNPRNMKTANEAKGRAVGLATASFLRGKEACMVEACTVADLVAGSQVCFTSMEGSIE